MRLKEILSTLVLAVLMMVFIAAAVFAYDAGHALAALAFGNL